MAIISRVYDPFPIPDHQGLLPTHPLDWNGIARKLVREVLQVQRHERVIISADPYFGGAALDALRCEIQRVRAIELATIMHWTPSLAALRLPNGRYADSEDDAAETQAMRELFAVADVFVLLMNDRRGRRTLATSQSDQVVEGWKKGRSAHLHWFHDPAIPDPAHPVNLALDRMNQRALLELDHDRLRQSMLAITAALRGRELRLTDSAGTDLRFRAGNHFHQNFGDASRERMRTMLSGRDREEEIPAGSLRTIPEQDSVEGVLVFPSTRDGESPALGRGMDCAPFSRHGLRFVFRAGHVVEIRVDNSANGNQSGSQSGSQSGNESGNQSGNQNGNQQRLDELWALETGAKDRLGELVLGCNPLLTPVAGSSFHPHYGFGAGVVRLILGDNMLSGGSNRSSFHRWLMWGDATLTAGGQPVIQDGKLIDLVASVASS